jgi:hypothetical protein
MINLALYGSERGHPRPLLEKQGALPERDDPTWPDATVARVVHGGNWRPEPGAWRAFRSWLRTRGAPIDLRIVDRTAVDLAEAEDPPTVVHLVGLEAENISAENVDQLGEVAKRMISNDNGLLVIESIGGGTGFAAGMGVRLAERIGGKIISIGAEHPIISGGGYLGGFDVSRVEYRPYALMFFGVRETSPRLRVIRVDGRDRVLLITDDVSHALLDQPVWGVAGYTTESARRIMSNVLRYAISERRAGGEDADGAASP